MRAALAARDMVTVVSLLHKHGMSQRGIADRVGIAAAEIDEILHRGRQILSYDLLVRFAEGLGIPRHLMGLSYHPPTGARSVTEAPRWTEAPVTVRLRREVLAPGWWEQPDLAEALAGHDFTTVFRHLRRHGLSNHDIATATGLTVSHVDSVVAGLNTVTAYHALIAVCDGLGVPRGAAGVAHTSTGPSHVAGEPGLPDSWTGTHIRALRRAMRHGVATFAARHGVTPRTVQMWEAHGPAKAPSSRYQQRLDATYSMLHPSQRIRYQRLLQASPTDPAPGTETDGHPS